MNKKSMLIIICFISTLATGQTFEWVKGIGGEGISNVIMKDIVATDDQGVFIVGSFSGTIDFDPSEETNTKVALNSDGFAARYDAAGSLVWVFTTNEIGNEEISAATFCNTLGLKILNVVEKSGGNAITMRALRSLDGSSYAISSTYYLIQGVTLDINGINKAFAIDETAFYIVGSYAGVLQFGDIQLASVGYIDGFCLKFSVTNTDWFTFNWAKRFGNVSNTEVNDVAINGQNLNPILVGGFSGTIDFGSGIHTSLGNKDVFVATLNSVDGTILSPDSVFTIGSISDDIANSIYRSPESYSPILIGGKFSNMVDFDPGSAVANITSIGSYDGFLASYNTSSTNNFSFNWASKVGEGYQDEVIDVVYDTNVYFAARIQNSTFGTSVLLGSLESNGNTRIYGGKLVPSTLNSQNYVTGLEMNDSGELYCAGISGVITDYDPGDGVTTLFPVGNAFDGYIQKMSGGPLNSNEFFMSNFVVNPNPANNLITVRSTSNIEIDSITIIDVNGKVVKKNPYENDSEAQVNISDLAKGLYLMKIETREGMFTKKIMKI